MAPHTILLLGGHGQLGHALQHGLAPLGHVRVMTRADADLSDPDALRVALRRMAETFKPTVVVNAAAYTAVDQAQTNAETAHAVNAQSPAVLAELAQDWGATLVHYSTDYVFDGTGSQPWQETDAPHPLSVYGASKLAGEQAVRAVCARHLLLRTSWVVGEHGGNFLKTMLRLAGERESLRVVADQIGAPTSAALLTDVTVQLIRAMQGADDQDPRWGTYHVAAAGETSWHGYAQHVIAGAMHRGAVLKTTPDQVHPIATTEYPLPAPRPMNSRLNTQKIQHTFGVTLPAWQQGVDAILDHLFEKKTA
jgi:dTDP-4-dehydrorhamnose reductase